MERLWTYIDEIRVEMTEKRKTPCNDCSYFDGIKTCMFLEKPTTPITKCFAELYELADLCGDIKTCDLCPNILTGCLGDRTNPPKKLKVHPHEGQLKMKQSSAQYVVALAGAQSGKCIRGDVLLSDGTLKPVGEIQKGDEVFSLDKSLKIVASKVKNTIISGELSVFRISTWSGRQLEISDTHPLLTKDGWKPLSELCEGDFIGVPRIYPSLGKKRYDINMLKILGYLLGDDGLTGCTIKFTTKSEEIRADSESCLPSPCKLNYSSKYDYLISGLKRGKYSINPVLDFVKTVGLHKCNSHTKFIPEFVFRLVKEDISIVLNRLFACAGWVDTKSIGYCSVSKQMIYQVQHLLLRFGILSRIRHRKVKFQNGISFAYELTITTKSELVKFHDFIGIFTKDSKLNQLIKSKKREQPKDLIPINISHLYKVFNRGKQNHLHQNDKERYNLIRKYRRTNIERTGLQEVVKRFEDNNLKLLSDSDIYWDTIKEIAFLGALPCWDLEIEGTHNFIANDFFAHNTEFMPTVIHDEILRCGSGDGIIVSSSFPLMDKKLVPIYRLYFEQYLNRAHWQEAKKKLIINIGDIKCTLYFGSAKNVESLESATANFAHLDEAGQDSFTLEAYEAVLRRVSGNNGRIFFTTTLYNFGWLKSQVYDRWLQGDTDYEVIQWDSIIRPGFSKTVWNDRKRKMAIWKFSMQLRGRYDRPAGQIYSDFDENIHLIKPFDIPTSWNFHVGIDPGAVHTGIVWVAEEPGTNKFYVIHSYLDESKITTKEHVKKAMQFPEYNRVIRWVGASRAEGQVRIDWAGEGIHVTEPEIIHVESGIDKVITLLREKRLFIFNTPENTEANIDGEKSLKDEFISYSRELDANGKTTDKIKDKNKYHKLDALRYFAVGIGNTGDYRTPYIFQHRKVPVFSNQGINILRERVAPSKFR